MVETTDLVFAIDSIPAVLAISRDPFIVYSSNVFAMLGLRSLYFLLAGATARLHYLRRALALILMLAAAKMLLQPFVHVPVGLSLGVIAGVFAGVVVASRLFPGAQHT